MDASNLDLGVFLSQAPPEGEPSVQYLSLQLSTAKQTYEACDAVEEVEPPRLDDLPDQWWASIPPEELPGKGVGEGTILALAVDFPKPVKEDMASKQQRAGETCN